MTEKAGKRYQLRLFLVLAVLVLCMVGLIVRIFWIQNTNAAYYRKIVADQLTYNGTLKAERGRILDAGGEQLATNLTKYRIFISPDAIAQEMKKAKEDGDYSRMSLNLLIADKLSDATGVPYTDILALANKAGRLDETVVASADKETAERVTELISHYQLASCVFISPVSERYYVYGNLASQVLGFVGADGNGAYGLEYYYNDLLSGTDGHYTVLTDASNRIITNDYSSRVEAKDGCTLHLTLDRHIQEVLEREVRAACEDSGARNGGCGIVMDVKTSAILAMATYPDFDCNSPDELTGFYAEALEACGYPVGSSAYNALKSRLQYEMWSNKPVSFSYIPGSTFKIVTAGIALESASVGINDCYTCTGSILSVNKETLIHCSVLRGHGTLTFAEGLQQSCNPWFITAGRKIGTSLFYDYIENLGYLRPSGIDLPGEGSTVFWSRNDFTEANLETCSFGQNFKVSPIRHLCALCSVANGGYLTAPYLVESVTDGEGNTVSQHTPQVRRQVFSRSVCSTVASILEKGVSGTGGSRNAYVAGYRVAAKTGTSEKIGDTDETEKICSCVAFAPVDDPDVIMIILVDTPTEGTIYGSTIAAPYVAEALADILPYRGVTPIYSEAESARLNVAVPDCVGSVSFAAQAKAEEAGLRCEIRGSGTVVTAQTPAGGDHLPKDSGKVILYLGETSPEKTVTVPNFLGQTAAKARQGVIAAGLNLNVVGTTNYETGTGAMVTEQYPAAGTKVAPGDIVTLTFRYTNLSDD